MPTLPVTPTQLAIALVLATIGSVIQGSIGFGLAVVAAPTLYLLYPHSIFVPGPLLLAAMMLTILIAYRERTSVDVGQVGVASVGRVLGMLPAAYAISVLDERYYIMLFAVLILLGVVLSMSGWHMRPTRGNLLVASTLSGFTGTISSVGGPPLALVYQNEEGPRIRGTMSAIFTIGTVISLSGLAWANKFGQAEMLVGLALAPAVLVGFFLSSYATPYIDGPRTRPLVLIASALSAAAILVRVLWT